MRAQSNRPWLDFFGRLVTVKKSEHGSDHSFHCVSVANPIDFSLGFNESRCLATSLTGNQQLVQIFKF